MLVLECAKSSISPNGNFSLAEGDHFAFSKREFPMGLVKLRQVQVDDNHNRGVIICEDLNCKKL